MIKLLIPFFLLVFQIVIFLPVIFPDYTPQLFVKPATNFFSFLPPIISVLYFALVNISEKRRIHYIFKIAIKSISIIFITVAFLLPLTFAINTSRCQQTGLCTGGEPFDYMSTIFLIIFTIFSTVVSLISSLVFGTLALLYKKYYLYLR